MAKQLSVGKRSTILILHEQGVSCQAIASNVGCTPRTAQCVFDPIAKEKRAASARKYHKENPAACSRTSKKSYIKHREKQVADVKAYRESEAGKDKIRQYRTEHKEQIKAMKQEYNKAHAKEIQRYRQKRAPESAAGCAKRRAMKASAMIGATVSQLAEIAEIYRRAKEDPKIRCYLCGHIIEKGHRHVDHIYPLSKGGAHRPSNLAIACDICNMSKNNKTPEEIGLLI